MKIYRLVLAVVAVGVVLGSIGFLPPDNFEVPSMASAASQIRNQGPLSSLDLAQTWVNSKALSAGDLRGKVVLIDFWTYSCINWLREVPYVRAWSEKYREQGLVVIGVHSPEFEFEKDFDKVRKAVKDRMIGYPVAVDGDHAIWQAFGNNYWPALYFVDANGKVRHRQFGEGQYEESEKVIQRLLAEAGNDRVPRDLVAVDARGPEAAADWGNLRSPENYVGYARTRNFASEEGVARGKSRVYRAPARLALNHWGLAGDWTFEKQFAVLNKPHGRIAYRFHARDLHLVMGPAAPGAPVRFRVLIDGQPPGAARGDDIDGQGNGIVSGHRLHQLIRQSGPIADRLFEIEFLDPGAQAFAFTFG